MASRSTPIKPQYLVAQLNEVIADDAVISIDTGANTQFSARHLKIRERQSLEVRGEAFNLTNSLRSNTPVTTFGTPTFGRVLSAQDPRIVQFAMKFVF